jgi:hypothetical protein
MAGRKSLREELQIIRRYADLSEPYFKVLKESLESDDKDEKKWAADNLKGAFAKMIPTTLEGGDDIPLQIQVITYGNTSQLPTQALSASATGSDGFGEEEGGNSLAPESGQG